MALIAQTFKHLNPNTHAFGDLDIQTQPRKHLDNHNPQGNNILKFLNGIGMKPNFVNSLPKKPPTFIIHKRCHRNMKV